MIIKWNQSLFRTAKDLTEILSTYWSEQEQEIDFEFEKLKAELESKATLTSDRWDDLHEVNSDIRQYKQFQINQQCFSYPQPLSTYKLTPAEENLLNRGLNFIPTPSREHPSHILQDFLLFDRKLRLKYFFMDKDTEQKIPKEDKPFKLTTGWTPPATQDMYFDNYRKFTHQELM